jgi:uncharacterized protein (PEP-CTERM system associated)
MEYHMTRFPPSRVTLPTIRVGVVAAVAAICWSATAQAQIPSDIGPVSGILPTTGFGNATSASIRNFVNPLQPSGNAQGINYGGSLGAQVGYIDNANGASTAQGSKPIGSFEGRLTPSIFVSGETRLVQVNLAYNPTLYYYPSDQSQNRISQNLNGSVQGTIIPETLFLNLRGFATDTSSSGVYNPSGTQTVNRQDVEQIYSFSAAPSLTHTFSDIGTLQAYYSISDTTTLNPGNGSNNNVNNINNINNGFGNYQPNYLVASGDTRTLTQSENATFTSGSDFGRYHHTFALTGTQTTGTNGTPDSHRDIANYGLAYAINRFVSLIGTVGYEDLSYGASSVNGVTTSNPYKVSGMIGGAGVKLTPNADSSATLTYGWIDGGASFTLDATYKPTARTSLYASSSSGITTNSQQISGFVSDSTINDNGISVDPNTGAPLQFANTMVGGTNQAYRMTRTSVTGALLLDRDTFSATVIASEQKNPGGPVIQNVNSNSVFGSLSWQHELSETLSSNLSAHFGVQQSPSTSTSASSSTKSVAIDALVSKIINEKLSASLIYSFINSDGNSAYGHVIINEILLGVTQRF